MKKIQNSHKWASWGVILQPEREENRFPSRPVFSPVSSKWMDICSYRHPTGHHFLHHTQEVQKDFPFSNVFSCFPKVGRDSMFFCYREAFPYSCFSFVTEIMGLYYLQNTAHVHVKGNCDCSHTSGFICLLFLPLLNCFSFISVCR